MGGGFRSQGDQPGSNFNGGDQSRPNGSTWRGAGGDGPRDSNEPGRSMTFNNSAMRGGGGGGFRGNEDTPRISSGNLLL